MLKPLIDVKGKHIFTINKCEILLTNYTALCFIYEVEVMLQRILKGTAARSFAHSNQSEKSFLFFFSKEKYQHVAKTFIYETISV